MPIVPRVVSFCRSIFRSADLDRDLDDELKAFADERTAHYASRGLSPDAARRAALVEIGGVEQVKERVRDRRIGWGFETLVRDFRYGLRMLARAPGFALVVIATLALVIGANATVFSVIHAVLWEQLPYADADRLVFVDADARGEIGAGISSAEALDLRGEPDLFERLGTVVSVDAHVRVGEHMERVGAASAHDDVLMAFGAEPLLLGRVNDADQSLGLGEPAFNKEGYVSTVVISHDLWQRMLGGDPGIIGRHIDVNNLDVRVVGVLRPDFRVFMPASATLPEVVDVWFPRPFERDRRSRGPSTVGRLTSGVTVEAAQARLDVLSRRLTTDYAKDYFDGPLHVSVRPLQEVLTEEVRPALLVLAGAVGFVLLIGCVNVGNLMLARARVRAPEMAVRRALGAGRGRLIRQLVTETTILVAVGALLGFSLAYGGVSLIDWLRPIHLPRQSQITVNGSVALFTTVVSVVVSLLFGLLPVASTAGKSELEPLRAGRSTVQRSGTRRLQRALVVAEVALSIVPLVAAGLMLRTFVNLENASIGFDASGLITGKVAVSRRQFPETKQLVALHRDALERVARLPGVEAVAAGGPMPFEGYTFSRTYGRPTDPQPFASRATLQSVFPGYLGITRTGLRAGRDFTMDDLVNEREVVIIDERMANQLWPDGAVGQRLGVSRGRSFVSLEVIGVTNPVRVTRVRDDGTPHMFVPYHFQMLEMALVVKTRESAATMGPAIKQAVESLGTRRPVYEIQPMQTYVDRSIGDARFTMLVLVGFAIAALLLAAVGLYGTLAYLTSQRTQEFGVRMALGASAARILRSVASEGLLLTAIGGALGLIGALAASAVLRDLLYGVAPNDTTTLMSVTALVAVVAVVAASRPAWNAANTDPCTALRAE